MESILNLAYIYFKYRFEQDTLESLVEWGVNRLVEEKGENNPNIILLAGINGLSDIQTKYEVEDLAKKIL